MNHDASRSDSQSTPPMSSGDNELTQTLLQNGMMLPPAQPGPLGRVGRFSVGRLLGTGGMGQVMLAEDPESGTRVAIKMIRPEFAQEPWAVRRFLAEAQHMHKMSHPNVLRVLEVADRPEGPYYVMPYVAGRSLADQLQTGQPLPREEVLRIARQVAEALGYAHSRGIIHRDLKPANVLMDRDGHAYLTDFGLLRTVFNDSMIDVTKPSVEGTAPYLSPNAAAGKAEDTRCDIYAFGALLYELLTGRRPFEGPNPSIIVNKILAGPPEPIRSINPAAPEDLVKIAEWAMARELRDRYAEMADITRDLERAERGEAVIGPHGRAPLTGWARIDRWNRWIGMAGCTIMAAVNLVSALTHGPRTDPRGTAFRISLAVLLAFFAALFAWNPRKRYAHLGEAFQRRVSVSTALAVWILCTLILAIGLLPQHNSRPATQSAVIQPGTFSQTHNIRLMADGAAVVTSEERFLNDRRDAANDFSFINSLNTVVAILDKDGNALPFEVVQEDDHYRYTARLQKPLRPGEEFVGKTVSRMADMTRCENGTWTYERHHTPIPETIYSETVILPAGADLLSSRPAPTRQSLEDGAMHLVFEAHLAENQSFDCMITYRLAPASSGSSAKSTDRKVNIRRRTEEDLKKYGSVQLDEIEELYQVANRGHWDSTVKANLLEVIRLCPDANRAGCATLYLGQMTEGAEKEQFLKTAIGKYNDCWYGDGVQVGAYARYQLASYYRDNGRTEESSALLDELRRDYPDAINHNGWLLLNDFSEERRAAAGSAAGEWETVDFVQAVDQFNPDHRSWRGDFIAPRFECKASGETSLAGIRCENGWAVSREGTARYRYEVKHLNGQDFLFLPWLSGDVTLRHKEPWYYVFRRAPAATAESRARQRADRRAAERMSAQAWTLWQQQKYAEAEALFQKTVDRDPENAEAWNGLGWSRFNEHMPLNAEDAFRKCLNLNSNHIAALNGMGWISKGRGDRAAAVQYWEHAVRVSPQATAALRGLAITCLDAGDNAAAAKYFQMWLDAEPGNAEAQAGLRQTQPLRPVVCKQGLNTLKDGDTLTLTDVLASSEELAVGDTVKVRGSYTLASRPKARLALYVTATEGEGRGPVRPEQWRMVEKGSGAFELSQVIRDHGCLHLTFYDADTEEAVGGLYFGTQAQVDEIAKRNH